MYSIWIGNALSWICTRLTKAEISNDITTLAVEAPSDDHLIIHIYEAAYISTVTDVKASC